MQRRAFAAAASVFAASSAWLQLARAGETAADNCDKVLYLTFDTGHMGIAELVARVLRKHRIPASFFAANEATQQGDGSLGSYWAPWWKARAEEGHALASHTYDHMYWLADVPDAGRRITHFKVRPSAGPRANQSFVVSAAEYGAEIARSNARLREITGHQPLPLYRAPGGSEGSWQTAPVAGTSDQIFGNHLTYTLDGDGDIAGRVGWALGVRYAEWHSSTRRGDRLFHAAAETATAPIT